MPDIVGDFDRLRDRLAREAKTPPSPMTVLLSPRQYREAQAHGGVEAWMVRLWQANAVVGAGDA